MAMSSFRLSSDDSSFNNRVNALFDSLDAAAASNPLTSTSDEPGDPAVENESRENEDLIFARPKIPVRRDNRRGRGAPDYIKHPEKWTRYSMKETKCLSDRENKELGLKMYEELRSQHAGNEQEHVDLDKRVIFKNPRRKVEELEGCEEEENPKKYQDTALNSVFGGTKKLVMREHEVGKVKSKGKGKKVKKDAESQDEEKRTDKVQLDYLNFEDEEED
ncbi:U5 small nuclear ribonucleoprotein TSSC4-like [Oratosquilla oratoria]|uniref:U5 small nuclear ribonucleoprotein TSSC4-like n=1 Tax=Oratosquilla oratoria TaxID=337810 RepID=UPI003F75EDD6